MLIDLKGNVPTKQDLQKIVDMLGLYSSVTIVNAYRRTPLHNIDGRQRDLLFQILQGKSNKEIASSWQCTEQVVKNLCRLLYKKLGLSGSGARMELVLRYKDTDLQCVTKQAKLTSAESNLDGSTSISRAKA